MSSNENWIHHCSHKKHMIKEIFSNADFRCGACHDQGTGSRYRCEPCDFDAHSDCINFPEFTTSFTHPQHQLRLKPVILPHECRLCKESGRGIMMYRCEAHGCKFILHTSCSLLPEILENHPKHPLHNLTLGPMDSKEKCDVCGKKCKNWSYNCAGCEIHIHLKCTLIGEITTMTTTPSDKRGRFWGCVEDLADNL